MIAIIFLCTKVDSEDYGKNAQSPVNKCIVKNIYINRLLNLSELFFM